jgi:hypothetical protein
VATQKKASDFTGRQRDALAQKAQEEQQNAANNMAMATMEANVKAETETIDATVPSRPTTVVVDDIKTVGAEANVTIRVSETVESMTLGAGNLYNFEAGKKYVVTKDVADHLDAKGYLAQRS